MINVQKFFDDFLFFGDRERLMFVEAVLTLNAKVLGLCFAFQKHRMSLLKTGKKGFVPSKCR